MKLKQWLKENGLSQTGLSLALGVSDRTVRRWCAGTWKPNLEHQKKLESIGFVFSPPAEEITVVKTTEVSPPQEKISPMDKFIENKIGPRPKREDYPTEEEWRRKLFRWNQTTRALRPH